MKKEIEKLRDNLTAKADDTENYNQRQFEVLTATIRSLNTILANDPEKPSEGQETPNTAISDLVANYRKDQKAFKEGYLQSMESTASELRRRHFDSLADEWDAEAVRIRGLK